MLTTILQKMVTSAVLSHTDLAKQLDIGEDLLEKMLEELARKGYLTSMTASDDEEHRRCSGCGACKACRACSPGHNPTQTGWALTAKGRAAATRRQP